VRANQVKERLVVFFDCGDDLELLLRGSAGQVHAEAA
jgi:hypothetical protein